MLDESPEVATGKDEDSTKPLQQWISSYLELGKGTVELLLADAQLAAISFVQLLIVSIACLLSLLIVWFCLLGLLCIFLLATGLSLVIVVLAVLVLHIIILIGCVYILRDTVPGMSFSASRTYIGQQSESTTIKED